MKTGWYYGAVLAFCFGLIFSCEHLTETDKGNPRYRISVSDVTCTEAWLFVSVADTLEGKLSIEGHDGRAETFICKEDTILYLDSLAPGAEYRVEMEIPGNEEYKALNIEKTFSTLDTTVYNYTWETYEFGELASNHFIDIEIIDENNIWAVGEVKKDLPQPNQWEKYNAVHWNGEEWTYKRILFYSLPNQSHMWPYNARTIFSPEDDNLVVVTSGERVTFIRDTTQIGSGFMPVTAEEIWGTSADNIYTVGHVGLGAHYDGKEWHRIETGIDKTFRGICGTPGGDIYFSGSNVYPSESILIKYSPNGYETIIFGEYISTGFKIDELFKTMLYGTIETIWADGKGKIITGGDYVFRNKAGRWTYAPGIIDNVLGGDEEYNRGYIYAIEGEAYNDYYLAGERGTFLHFNGVRTEHFGERTKDGLSYIFYNMDIYKNIVAVVGRRGHKAVVRVYKRD